MSPWLGAQDGGKPNRAGEGGREGGCGELPSALISIVSIMLLGAIKEKKKKGGGGLWGGNRQELQIHLTTTKSD